MFSLTKSSFFSSPHKKDKYQKNRRGKDIVKGSAVETLEKQDLTLESLKEVKAGANWAQSGWNEKDRWL